MALRKKHFGSIKILFGQNPHSDARASGLTIATSKHQAMVACFFDSTKKQRGLVAAGEDQTEDIGIEALTGIEVADLEHDVACTRDPKWGIVDRRWQNHVASKSWRERARKAFCQPEKSAVKAERQGQAIDTSGPPSPTLDEERAIEPLDKGIQGSSITCDPVDVAVGAHHDRVASVLFRPGGKQTFGLDDVTDGGLQVPSRLGDHNLLCAKSLQQALR
jgi:hypothetical protein